MKVTWSPQARQQLRGIRDYIALDSPTYARQTVERIKRRTWQIKQFPLLGGIVPEYCHDDLREVLEGSYRIIYRVSQDRAEIAAVIHGAQTLPPTL